MDFIPSHQLQKYEEILNEINREHEKSLKLKKEIQQVDDTITFQKLSSLSCERKISHVNVKIFSGITEIENLYDKVDLYGVTRDGNFFVTEVFLTKTLLCRMTSISWKLHLTIQSDSVNTSKIVRFNTEKKSVVVIIPFDSRTHVSCVTASLFNYSEDHWNIVDLCRVNVDISYYFESCKEKNSNIPLGSFLNITQLYNSDKTLGSIKKPLELQSQVRCDLTHSEFISEFVKNSYHRLCLESFSNFVSDKNRRVIDLQFYIEGEKVVMLYHKENKILKIKCDSSKTAELKKFFMQLLKNDWKGFRSKAEKIKYNDVEDMDLDEVLLMHKQLKKLWLSENIL